jgi:REP element-mobilizing transposase RayT
MPYDPDKHHRRSIRLPGYDYRHDGMYFVTLCTQDRALLFGTVTDGTMTPSDCGQIVVDSWQWLAQQYPYVSLDLSVLMPNHFHGILIIGEEADDPNAGASRSAPTSIIKRKPLGRLIGAFKTVSTKQINQLRDTPGAFVWQRNYYEHIIRSERSLYNIRQYIETNPARWMEDSLYVGNS